MQPQQLLFDLALALRGDCVHSKSVSKDSSVFFKSGNRGWKRIHLDISGVE